jgi:glycosyltransferase involved in cell wall biosynthesis
MADTIEESLQTITEELPADYEIVIVNQSSDGSRDVIDRIASASELSFKTIHTDLPLGVGHARNLAVCQATRDIVVTHVDADDWYNSRFFPAFVDLYRRIKDSRGTDFFFSCPNMNISSREHMLNEYLLSSLPIGANEKEYRWRAYKNNEYVRAVVGREVSGRIKLSDRKTINSRMKRTHLRHIGMYKIDYDTRRILEEDVFYRDWPL